MRPPTGGYLNSFSRKGIIRMSIQAKQALTTTYHLDLLHRYLENGSLGIAVVKPRIWGCERAHAHIPKSGHLHGKSQKP